MQYVVAFALGIGLAACATADTGALDAPKSDDDDARVDAPPGAIDAPLGTIDAALPIDAAMAGNPDTCTQANDLTAAAMGAGTTVSGNTTGYADDVATPSACTGYTSDGPDAIYAVNLTAGQVLTATATPTSPWDISLELVMPCTITPTCLDGADSGFGGDPEIASYTATSAVTVFVVVDGYNPGVAGAYSLNVRIQ